MNSFTKIVVDCRIVCNIFDNVIQLHELIYKVDCRIVYNIFENVIQLHTKTPKLFKPSLIPRKPHVFPRTGC